jgi:hypothetical protein
LLRYKNQLPAAAKSKHNSVNHKENSAVNDTF